MVYYEEGTMKWIGALIAVGLLAACTKVVEVPGPVETVSVAPVTPAEVTGSYGDPKACGLLRIAVHLPDDGHPWEKAVEAAQFAARDYDLERAIKQTRYFQTFPWTGTGRSGKWMLTALGICVDLGV